MPTTLVEAEVEAEGVAFGAPGIAPRWTVSAKNGVGTAYSAASDVWYTLSLGVLSEIYYPHIDRPQTRDLQYLITDGETFFHEEKRDLATEIELIDPHALGFRVVNSDPEGRYRLIKEIIGVPHQDVLLVQTRLEADDALLERLQLFVLLAPHLQVGGWGNNGWVQQGFGRTVLTAEKEGIWLVMAATAPYLHASSGYVGASDGWSDLKPDMKMDWRFAEARDGNIALTGQIDLDKALVEDGCRIFTLGIGFGDTYHSAATALFQGLDVPYEDQRARFIRQWNRTAEGLEPLSEVSGDGGRLYRVSNSLLLAHEDKVYQGATIASLSIPWGQARGDDDAELGGYHLVWTRDMCNTVMGMLAAGNVETPLRALVYLSCTQCENGGFYQNFWINGTAHWTGIQLDAVAFPIILAWQLRAHGALRYFDPYPMVRKAAAYLIRECPVTPQERWEENSGYSPSTLASNIAALTCAAQWTRERGDEETADFIQNFADFLECHVEAWTVTTQGALVEGITEHYIRINPADPEDPIPDEDPDDKTVILANRPPGSPYAFPARDIVDAGFLELVRYGIRAPGNDLVENSLRVVDALLKVDTPKGPVWRRYNHDGYGQRDDGGPYVGWGTGRAWPLLTGERGHYELAAGRDPMPYIRAMENFANPVGLLTEQVWDSDDLPEQYMFLGEPTGAAMPLAWAHAEYIKLLRSTRDGAVFDCIDVVSERYGPGSPCPKLVIWKFNWQIQAVKPGGQLRILGRAPFRLRWTADDWADTHDLDATVTSLGIAYADIDVAEEQRAPLHFTFYWPRAGRWEGRTFRVDVDYEASGQREPL